ncbi:sugar ABC transporter permease, partial [Gardnerella vaginalis]
RAKSLKTGLLIEPLSFTITKIVVSVAAIGFITYLLASSGNSQQGGI